MQRVAAGSSAGLGDRRKKMPYLRILLPSKTDNPFVKPRHSNSDLPPEPPEDEPYASFLQRKDEISAWLRSGYSVKN